MSGVGNGVAGLQIVVFWVNSYRLQFCHQGAEDMIMEMKETRHFQTRCLQAERVYSSEKRYMPCISFHNADFSECTDYENKGLFGARQKSYLAPSLSVFWYAGRSSTVCSHSCTLGQFVGCPFVPICLEIVYSHVKAIAMSLGEL